MKITPWLLVSHSLLLPLAAQTALQPPEQEWQMRFDGKNAVVMPVGAVAALGNTYTLQLWAYPERRGYAILAERFLDDPDSDPFFSFQLLLDTEGHVGWGSTRGTPGSQMSSRTQDVLPLNRWTHIAVTNDGAFQRIYINGVLARQQFSPGPPGLSGQPIHLGATVRPPDGSNPGFRFNGFIGLMRQFGIWNYAKSAGEIRAAMETRFEGSEEGLAGFWPLDDGPGYTFRDLVSGQTASLIYSSRTKLINGNANNPVVEQYWPVWFRPALWDANPFEWSEQVQSSIEVSFGTLIPIDFDNDGDLDLIGSSFYNPKARPSTLHAYRNDGKGFFTEATNEVFGDVPIVALSAGRAATSDLNHDGRADLILTDAGSDYFCCKPAPAQNRVFIQTADGRLAEETLDRMPIRDKFAHDSDFADIDGDGNVDLFFADINLVTEPPYFRMTLMVNDGSGHFAIDNSRLPPSLSKRTVFSARFLDANRDGFPDLFLGPGWSDRDLLLLNDGTGHFQEMAPGALPLKNGGPNSSTRRVAVGDLNNDGWPDLVLDVEAVSHAGYQILINRGDGTYYDGTLDWLPETVVQRSTIAANHATDAGEMFLQDFNGDGYPDLLLNREDQFWRLYLNNGSRLVNFTDFLPSLRAGTFATGDFDGDGRIDIAYGQNNGAGKAVLVIGMNRRDYFAPTAPAPDDPPAPMIGPFAVVSDASLSPEAVAPGMRVRIRGQHLGPEEPVAAEESAGAALPSELAGVVVTFDSTPARLISVSTTEAVAIVPFAVSGQWVTTVRVSYQGRASQPVNVFVSDTVPMAYATPVYFAGGVAGFVVNAWKIEGSVRTKVGPGVKLNWGDRVAIRVTGAGQGQTPLSDDSLTQTQDFTPVAPLPVMLGQSFSASPIPLSPISMTYAPEGLAGVVEIVVDLPSAQPEGVWVNFFIPDGRRLTATLPLLWPFPELLPIGGPPDGN
ncbi:MAG: FG-GAP-like repeat-containing protein [Acidobacteriota bacterium]